MAAKSAQLLAVHDNYTRQGKKCLIVKPQCDHRYGAAVASRLGGRQYVDFLLPEKPGSWVVSPVTWDGCKCLLVDEAQFLSRDWVDHLRRIPWDLGIPVICYGLRADYRGIPFDGSTALFAAADVLEEIKTICWVSTCNRKATQNFLWDMTASTPSEHHAAVMVGKAFIPLCSGCWDQFTRFGPSNDLSPPSLEDA